MVTPILQTEVQRRYVIAQGHAPCVCHSHTNPGCRLSLVFRRTWLLYQAQWKYILSPGTFPELGACGHHCTPTFPGIPSLSAPNRLCPKHSDLNPQLVPPPFANSMLRTRVVSCSPTRPPAPKLAEQWASHPVTFSSLHSSSHFLT